MLNKLKICHLSSAHSGLDVRIFHKQCMSLAKAGYETHLVICANKNEIEKASDFGIKIHPLEGVRNRLERMLFQSYRCYKEGKKTNSDIYHFHDPELIPYGILLRISGKKVIYDVHEDVAKDILSKNWINKWLKKPLSFSFRLFELIASRFFFSISAATPSIAKVFENHSLKVVDINNYPLLGELSMGSVDWSQKKAQVGYVGGIDQIRGIFQVVQAMGLVQSEVRLQLAGKFNEPTVEQAARALKGWQRVDALGFVGRENVRDLLSACIGGLVTFLPYPNHIDAQPNKMFEYMSAGIPVIGSHFPLWKQIIEGSQCGLCVDPLDPKSIAEAIDFLIAHPLEAERMGHNGQKAVQEKYNWEVEERKLIDFYNSLTD